MFVRWKNRTLARKNGSGPAERSLYAVIVKNQRVEGRTKQKVVKYLAHISEGHLNDPIHQSHFWERVDQALAELVSVPELAMTPELRKEIESKLASVVARPSRPEGSLPSRSLDAPNDMATFRRVRVSAAVGVES
jgi:hypothetical protein